MTVLPERVRIVGCAEDEMIRVHAPRIATEGYYVLIGIEGLTASPDDDAPDVKCFPLDLDPTMMT